VLKTRFATIGLVAAALVTMSLPAGAGHTTDPRTTNMDPKGHIEEPASVINPAIGNTNIHTDIAFWGKHAFQGSWLGFNIRNISDPDNPQQVSFTECSGNQGDVAVWDDILVRSWNTPAGTPGPFGAGTTCDGEPVSQFDDPALSTTFEGITVFDISDRSDPELVGGLETECGSHTATLVPDLARERLVVYSNVSGGCNFIDIIQIPLEDPGDVSQIGTEPLEHPCHDMGVILGDVMKAGCAGGDGVDVFDLDGPGGLDDPEHLAHIMEPGVTVGHSAAFTWDGQVIVFGWEPGGGVQAECEESDDDLKKSFFFYDADDAADDGNPIGFKLGQWTLERDQSNIENCTLHNYNVVPLRSGRYVLVHGSYQSGTAVLDFTDPANAVELGWSDPPPIPPVPGSPFCAPNMCEIGGAWSSYWYNNFIYESNITEGLNVFRFSGPQTGGAIRLGHLNPQTQEFSL
jgi:hypothetical protein